MTEPAALREGLKSLLKRDAPFKVRPQWRVAMWWWLWQFARHCSRRRMLAAARHQQALLESSMHEYEALLGEYAIDAEWRRQGLLYVLLTPQGMGCVRRPGRHAAARVRRRRAPVRGARELPAFDAALRPGLAGAFHYETDASRSPGCVDERLGGIAASPRRVLRGELPGERGSHRARNAGQRRNRPRAARRRPLRRRCRRVDARHLAGELACSIPLEPGKGYSITMSNPSVSPAHPMLFPEHRVGATPFRDGFRLGSMLELAGFDTSVPRRRIAQLVEPARLYLVEPEGAEVRETWFGWAPHRLGQLAPSSARVPGLGNAVLATGHHMLGMTMAPGNGTAGCGDPRRGSAAHRPDAVLAGSVLVPP